MKRTKIISLFKNICVVIVTVMIGYWFYKYEIEDRDVGVVDYRSFDESTNDFRFPILSLCIQDPFLKQKSKNNVSNPFHNEYAEYLKGDVSKDAKVLASYEESTINLNKHFTYAIEKWNNESQWRKNTLILSHANVFNGFCRHKFLKCFSIESNIDSNRHIQQIQIFYNLTSLLHTTTTEKLKMFFKVNYPGQFLLGDLPTHFSSQGLNLTSGNIFIRIKRVEVLKRRNTRNKKCSVDAHTYDEMVLKKHVEMFGCSPTYVIKQEGFPTCNASEEKESRFQYENARNINPEKDCHRMSEVRAQTTMNRKSNSEAPWRFGWSYPEEIRVITHSQEVDIHSLIGNIGGYIGLFLGYALIQLPGLIFQVYDHLKKAVLQVMSGSSWFQKESLGVIAPKPMKRIDKDEEPKQSSSQLDMYEKLLQNIVRQSEEINKLIKDVKSQLETIKDGKWPQIKK